MTDVESFGEVVSYSLVSNFGRVDIEVTGATLRRHCSLLMLFQMWLYIVPWISNTFFLTVMSLEGSVLNVLNGNVQRCDITIVMATDFG